MSSDPTFSDPPALVVLHGGDPTPEELAALVVALSTRQSGLPVEPPARSGWADRRALLRKPLHPGSGQWVTAGRPSG